MFYLFTALLITALTVNRAIFYHGTVADIYQHVYFLVTEFFIVYIVLRLACKPIWYLVKKVFQQLRSHSSDTKH